MSEEQKPNPARISHTTVANLETDAAMAAARTQSPASTPGAGGWVPRDGTPLWVSIVVGVLASSAPVALAAIPAPWNLVAAAAIAGVGTGLASYFGIKSAGPRAGG